MSYSFLRFIYYLWLHWVFVGKNTGNSYPLQYSCLGTLMDRGAWWATQSLRSKRVGDNWMTKRRQIYNIFLRLTWISSFEIFLSLNLWLRWVFVAGSLSSCGEWVCSPAVVLRLLPVVASLVAERPLERAGFSSCGAQVHLPRGTWDRPEPGIKPLSPCPLLWQVDS